MFRRASNPEPCVSVSTVGTLLAPELSTPPSGSEDFNSSLPSDLSLPSSALSSLGVSPMLPEASSSTFSPSLEPLPFPFSASASDSSEPELLSVFPFSSPSLFSPEEEPSPFSPESTDSPSSPEL